MSKFTHNGYEFDNEKVYLYGSSVVVLSYEEYFGTAGSIVALMVYSTTPEFRIPDDDLHTLREVTIGDPVEKKFVPRKGQAVAVSNDGEDWCIYIFKDMFDGRYRVVNNVRYLSDEQTGGRWKYCKPLPEEMK